MVSVERYLRAFVKVMPQRTKMLRSSMRKKKALDSELEKTLKKYKNQRQIKLIVYELKLLIGEDMLFNSAERRNRQTLRHYLWKFLKSFKFFIESRNFIGKRLEKEPKYATQFLTLLKESTEDSQNLLGLAKSLDELYIAEVESLEKNNFDKYLSHVQEENEIIKSIAKYGASVKQRQGGALRFVQSYLNQTGKTKHDRDGRKLALIMIPLAIGMALFFYFGFVPYLESEGKDKEFANWLTLLFGVIAPPLFYKVFVGEDTPMRKIIREYVSETI